MIRQCKFSSTSNSSQQGQCVKSSVGIRRHFPCRFCCRKSDESSQQFTLAAARSSFAYNLYEERPQSDVKRARVENWVESVAGTVEDEGLDSLDGKDDDCDAQRISKAVAKPFETNVPNTDGVRFKPIFAWWDREAHDATEDDSMKKRSEGIWGSRC